MSGFFAFGALAAATAAAALLTEGGALDAVWRLNPRAHQGLLRFGPWAAPLLVTVAAACLAASIGLWRTRAWGRQIAIGLLAVNLVGDAVNAISGDWQTLVGIPIAAAMLAYLGRRRIGNRFG